MSVQLETTTTYTAEDMASAEIPEKQAELIEGELVVNEPASKYHNRIAFNIQCMFRDFCKLHPELEFGTDNEGFLVQRKPDTLLSPDACLWRKRPESDDLWMEFSPEIAVEVLSRTNRRTEMAYKRQKYFGAGSEQVWIADPEQQTLEICFRDGRRLVAEGAEIIQGEGIVGGMQLPLLEIFAKSW